MRDNKEEFQSMSEKIASIILAACFITGILLLLVSIITEII